MNMADDEPSVATKKVEVEPIESITSLLVDQRNYGSPEKAEIVEEMKDGEARAKAATHKASNAKTTY
jgi:hypothetical protein